VIRGAFATAADVALKVPQLPWQRQEFDEEIPLLSFNPRGIEEILDWVQRQAFLAANVMPDHT
jgi:hypothetical protein